MARPLHQWHIFASDICRICDLTERSITALEQAGEVKNDDIHSLLVFTATFLNKTHRKALQLETGGKFITTFVDGESEPSSEEPAVTRLRWKINSDSIGDALSVTRNSIHLARSRKQLDPGDLLSLLRFACFLSRADKKAPIMSALFAEQAAKMKEPNSQKDRKK